jgi:hypothetical protein
VRNDLRATTLLEEEPLQEIRRPDNLPMANQASQVGDAGVEVLEETLHECRQLSLVSWTKSSRSATYHELGADYYDRHHSERVARRAIQPSSSRAIGSR